MHVSTHLKPLSQSIPQTVTNNSHFTPEKSTTQPSVESFLSTSETASNNGSKINFEHRQGQRAKDTEDEVILSMNFNVKFMHILLYVFN